MNYQTLQIKPGSFAVAEDILLKLGGVYGVINWHPSSRYSSAANGLKRYRKDRQIDRERELFNNSEIVVFPPIYHRVNEKFHLFNGGSNQLLLFGHDAHLKMRHLRHNDPYGLSKDRLDPREIPNYNRRLFECYERVTGLLLRPNVTMIEDGMSLRKRWRELEQITPKKKEEMLKEVQGRKILTSHAQYLLLCRLYGTTVFSNNENVKEIAFRHGIPFVDSIDSKTSPQIVDSSTEAAPELIISR